MKATILALVVDSDDALYTCPADRLVAAREVLEDIQNHHAVGVPPVAPELPPYLVPVDLATLRFVLADVAEMECG